MSKVKSKNTKPEMIVRRGLFALGYRYRIHTKLEGKPDIVLPKREAVIFVHGCFWHGHECKRGTLPKSNTEFWSEKINRNKARDREHRDNLERAGWRVLEVYECAFGNSRKQVGNERLIETIDAWICASLDADVIDKYYFGRSFAD